MLKQLVLVCLFQLAVFTVQAQTSFNGWLFSNHEQQLSKKWSLLSDVQLRSANALGYLETVLLRPAAQYKFSDVNSAAVGYAYLGNWEREGRSKLFELEQRIWQQYVVEVKVKKSEMNHRLRLEQRFLEAGDGFDFAQRLRYYLRTQFPLAAGKDFKRGAFAVLQNEVFLNVQNKEKVNGRFFDQNRLYGAIGYRWSERVDVELGYMYRYQIEEEKMHNHILQVQVSTMF